MARRKIFQIEILFVFQIIHSFILQILNQLREENEINAVMSLVGRGGGGGGGGGLVFFRASE